MRAAVLALASALLPWQAAAVLAAPSTHVCPFKRGASECRMACHRPPPVQSVQSVPSCHRVPAASEPSTDGRACFVTRRCSGPGRSHDWVPETPYLFASGVSVEVPTGRVLLAASPLTLPVLSDLPPPSPPPRPLIDRH